MKKLIVTIAIVLSMGMTTFAQEAFTGADGVSENGLFSRGSGFFNGELSLFSSDYYYELDDEEDMAYNNYPQNYVDNGLFGLGVGIFNGNRNTTLFPNLPSFNETTDQNAPLGSGIAVLMGLGAAYLVGKRRKED